MSFLIGFSVASIENLVKVLVAGNSLSYYAPFLLKRDFFFNLCIHRMFQLQHLKAFIDL